MTKSRVRRLKRRWRELRRSVRRRVDDRRFARSVEHVHGALPNDLERDDCVVIAMVRDAERYLPAFLEHHFQLGARHVLLLDNGSGDRTVEIACADDRVTVHRTRLPFKTHKMHMRRWLARTAGARAWVLLADVDEHFDYPGSHVLPLRALLRDLDANGFTAVHALMLDLVPTSLADAEVDGRPFPDVHTRYDVSAVCHLAYPTEGDVELGDPETVIHRGGIRGTVFGLDQVLLSKHPLMRCSSGLQMVNAHFVKRARVADFTALIKHYKFVPGFRAQVVDAVAGGQYFEDSVEYHAYAARLAADPALRFESPGLREYAGLEPLVEAGVIRMSDRYRALASGVRASG